ncbi:MAG: manno-octulosonate cytidylyltransferase [Litorimonas sp.]
MLIVVPARHASTRFPAKPLADICGISMVRRTAKIAQTAARELGCAYVVATDHHDITAHCNAHDIPVIMTDSDLASGSDRALAAAQDFKPEADFIINLQGDAPFTPPQHIVSIAGVLRAGANVATPYIRLSWKALDDLRRNKDTTPFSGTTLIIGKNDGDESGLGKDGRPKGETITNKAIWFSKAIIPAIRNEGVLRKASNISPICRHIGLYGYRREALEQFVSWPPSPYETLEGLEQLRFLENGITIDCVEVTAPKIESSGIDSPEDLARAEILIAQHGDPFVDIGA